MPDRLTAPAIHEVNHLILPTPEIMVLENGIPAYILDYPAQEMVKLEVVYRVGRPEENKRLAARATARLLREGTIHQTGAEIAEHLDYYGATVNIPTNLDTSSFVLFSVRKYAQEVIPTFAEMLHYPSFSLEELDSFRRTSMQELLVELEKGETLAYRTVTELIFGEHHPYGYNSTAEDYEAIQQADLISFFNTWYQPSQCLIFASGRIDAEIRDLIKNHFGVKTQSTTPLPLRKTHQMPLPPINPKKAKVSIPLEGSLQTAIKMGCRMFARNHPDFNGMVVLNTILGGYFGSRLMANVREKKGLTYNIYSSLDAYQTDGCLYVATEVSPDKADTAVRAIFAEMKKLRDTPIPAEELSMVRNYIMGMLLNGLDGPMNSSDALRSLIVENQTPEDFSKMVETVRSITQRELQILAQKYFDPAHFWVVRAG